MATTLLGYLSYIQEKVPETLYLECFKIWDFLKNSKTIRFSRKKTSKQDFDLILINIKLFIHIS